MATEGPAKLDRRNWVSIPEHGEGFSLGSKDVTLETRDMGVQHCVILETFFFLAWLKWPVLNRLA